MTAIAFTTAVGAQFKINPFREDYFRIGLGVSILLFLLMIMPHLSYVKTGILTGIANLLFQSVDLINHVQTRVHTGKHAGQSGGRCVLCGLCLWA